ncbi:uncharacterized protein MELLADRAFT_109589 [Melampsora larici-populina 98AG31]|uniref:Uncharacterized protein n=1 Tax=Melampsora larici-populina (strain 98AG31 / pathotype 3-4-7) TaxID=747676 RepID=F4RWZ3_MELLP|nr:uncharacterized protein MELLADRAFT_109589 [Melampsora larici-populina 98AG31]EGG03136.1 hypothetical protein MELLADRAFT_109589 [Melampsora larici-populina 98AG31]
MGPLGLTDQSPSRFRKRIHGSANGSGDPRMCRRRLIDGKVRFVGSSHEPTSSDFNEQRRKCTQRPSNCTVIFDCQRRRGQANGGARSQGAASQSSAGIRIELTILHTPACKAFVTACAERLAGFSLKLSWA